MIPIKNILKDISVILGISVLVAFSVNYLSTKGISLFGNWDLSSGVITANPKGYEENRLSEITDIETAKTIFNKGEAIFVDARGFESYTSGHIKGAASFPVGLFGEKIEQFLKRYATSTPIVTYCSGRTCEDSHKLAQLLLMEGYHNVRIFIDGYPAWEERGYPIE